MMRIEPERRRSERAFGGPEDPLEEIRIAMGGLSCVYIAQPLVRFATRYREGESHVLRLQQDFEQKNAERYSGIMRAASKLFTAFILFASIADFNQAKAKDRLDEQRFHVVIGCKLGVMAPVGLLMIWYTHSRYYISHTRYLSYVLFMVSRPPVPASTVRAAKHRLIV